MICDYGCGREAKYPFKNGKWCCSKSFRSCPFQRNKHSIQMKDAWKDPNNIFNSISFRENRRKIMKKLWDNPDSKYNSILFREKRSKIMKKERKNPNSVYNSKSYKEKQSNSMKELWKNPNGKLYLLKLTIEKIKVYYPTFFKEEGMRYNPDNPEEKEIQVHCKNHECKNSKEKGGWFTPTIGQFIERREALELPTGNDGSYLYCSQHCKDSCILYALHNDPYEIKNNKLPYTSGELDVFNKHILKRDNEICYYCNKHHATIVHHLRPQKLEPFFALDPDYAISVCFKCHYKYGHPTGSEHSTGNLAKIVCSVESQKFLNQKL